MAIDMEKLRINKEFDVYNITDLVFNGGNDGLPLETAYLTNQKPNNDKNWGNEDNGDFKVAAAKDAYGTICLPYLSAVAGATIYEIAGKNDEGIELTPYEGLLAAGKPYFYQAADNKSGNVYFYKAAAATVEAAGENNGLVGTFAAIASEENLVVVNNELREGAVAANSAYVDLAKVEGDATEATLKVATEPLPDPVFPEAGAKGYLYNKASGLFLTGKDVTVDGKNNVDIKLVYKADVTETDIYTVWYKKASENDGKNIRLGYGKYGDGADEWASLRWNNNKLVAGDNGYCKWTLAISEDENDEGAFTLYYPSSYSSYGPEGYLTIDPENKTFSGVTEEATEYAKWQFLTQEEFDNLPTAIKAIAEKSAASKAIFNVAGQQIKSLQKGLNIVDGKKVYVK
jgi:hypothetical protein